MGILPELASGLNSERLSGLSDIVVHGIRKAQGICGAVLSRAAPTTPSGR